MAVAASQRPALTSLPPQIQSIRADLGLSLAAISLLTAIPLLCFGVSAPLGVSQTARSRSPEVVIFFFLVLLTLASGVRVLAGWPLLYFGTIVMGIAIAALNVIVPVVIKRDFPKKITTIMPIYTAIMSISATLGAALSVPISNVTTHNWRGGIGFFALPGLLAIALWAPRVYHRRHDEVPKSVGHRNLSRSLRRDPIAWAVTIFFGIQSANFYSIVAWLPKTFIDSGYSSERAGAMLGLATAISIPASLLLPMLLGRGLDQRRVVIATTGFSLAGFLGMSFSPTAAPILWVVMIGIGQASFPASLVMMALRARSSAETAPLSAMTQGFGYLVSAMGPILVGFMYQHSGTWTLPYALMAFGVVVQFGFGMKAGRPRLGEIDHREISNV
ncbi:MAG TPA: MFS transporter [Candidatus Nanopelagicaceae bacterium]|nr:MFS transporter [Candidatus Nanopelagicaceae bacterium]